MDLDCNLWSGRFSEWMRIRNWSQMTIISYNVGLKQFFCYLIAQGHTSLGAVTRDVVEGYRSSLFYRKVRGKPLSISTQRARLTAVKSFLRFLARENYLLVDVASTVDLPQLPEHLPLVLSEEQVVRLLESPDATNLYGIRDRAVLEVLYATALRSGELRALCLEDLDRERQALWVRQGKGKKSRIVPIGDEALAWLDEYLMKVRPAWVMRSEENHIFVTHRGNPFDSGWLQRMVGKRAVALGFCGVHPHTLRHSCATHMLARGAGLRHLQVMLGHGSPMTTGHYTKVELTDLHKVLQRCHPRERRWGQR